MDPRNHPQISNRIPVQNFSPMHQQQPTSPIGSISMPIPQFEMSSMHVQNIQQHTQNIQQQQQQHSQNMGSALEPPRSALGLGHVSIEMRRNNSSNNSDDSDASDEINQYVVEALFPLIDDLCVLTKSVGRFGVKLMSMNIFDKSKFDDIMDDRDDYARVYKLYNGALRVNAGRKLVEALLTSDNYNVIQFIKENVMEPNVLMEMERIEQHLVDTLRLNFNQHMGHHSASSSAETSAAATLLLLESRGGSSGVNVSVNSHSHSAQNQNNHPTLNTELTRGSYDELLQQSLGSGTSTEENNMPPRNNVPFAATVAALFPVPIGPTDHLSSAGSTGGDRDNAEKVKHKRRKKAAPDEWERAKNKKLRMQGLEYMGYKKCKDGGVEKNILIVRKKRQIGPPCSSRKCSAGSYTSCSKFTDESRQNIFQNFWTRMNWEQRKTYVSSLVDVVKIKRSTVQGHESRRSSSLRYMLKLNGEKKRVCKQMFLSTLGIGSHSVHSWILKPDGPGSGSGSSSSFMGVGVVGTGRSPKKSQLSSMSVTLTSASNSKPVKTKKAKATAGAGGLGAGRIASSNIAIKIEPEPTFTSTISSMVIPGPSQEVNPATAATITNLTSVSSVSIEPLQTQVVALAEPTPTHTVVAGVTASTISASVDSNSNISTINSNSNISASPLPDDNDNDEVDDENDNDQLDDQSDDPAAASSSTTGGNVGGSSSLNPGAHFLVKDYFDSLVKMPQEYLSIVHE